MANSSVCLDAFQTIVLPWLREHYVLPGAALVRMGNVSRSFHLCRSASQYFRDWLVTRTSFGCIVHQVAPPCVAYRLYHADCLQRCFLRRISCSSQPPTITGSFAVSEYLRAKVRSRWVPNDIDIFIDDVSLFWEYIRVYREMVLSPLGIKDHLYLSAAYNGPSLVLDVTGDVTVREIAAAASAATIVRVWPISSVWRAVTEWLDSYDARTSLSVGMLRALRNVEDHLPTHLEQQAYKICSTARYHLLAGYGVPSTLVKPNFILVEPRPPSVGRHDSSFAQHITSNFDITLCSVWLEVDVELGYTTRALPDAVFALSSGELQVRPTSFVRAPFDESIEQTVARSLRRVAKYVTRGFRV